MLARKYAESNETSTIYSRHIRKIKWVQTLNPDGLKEREKHTFRFIAAALKINQNASKIKMSLGAFAACQRNADLPGSTATVRRALAGLESKGFLWRRRCRLGDDRHGLEICLNLEHWTYWTQKSASNVCPIPSHEPTSVHITSRQSMRLAEENTSVVNTRNTNTKCNHARARANSHKYEFLKANPILLTLWILLRSTPDIALFNRAELEIKAISSGNDVAIQRYSGIPWEDYMRNWGDMTQGTRDTFAATQIIPALRRVHGGDDTTSEPLSALDEPYQALDEPYQALDEPYQALDDDPNAIRDRIIRSLKEAAQRRDP